MNSLKTQAYDDLRLCCGFVENGSETTVKIHQDDATKSFIVEVGRRKYVDSSLPAALRAAAEDNPIE